MPRLLLLASLLCAGCFPARENLIRIARHALLDRGFHSIALEDTTLRCFPAAGFEFSASTAHGERVAGVVCCGSSEGEVLLDGVQHP